MTRLPVIIGVLSMPAFCVGWVLDLAAQPTMIVGLVCGMSAVVGQVATRDLLSKVSSLVERGGNEYFEDGGELLEQATRMQERAERLVLSALLAGVLATFFGALRTVVELRFFSATALTLSMASVSLMVLLFLANRELTTILNRDRVQRAHAKRLQGWLAAEKPTDAKAIAADPNLSGYQVDNPWGSSSPEEEATSEHK